MALNESRVSILRTKQEVNQVTPLELLAGCVIGLLIAIIWVQSARIRIEREDRRIAEQRLAEERRARRPWYERASIN